jgi:hypothetical protein
MDLVSGPTDPDRDGGAVATRVDVDLDDPSGLVPTDRDILLITDSGGGGHKNHRAGIVKTILRCCRVIPRTIRETSTDIRSGWRTLRELSREEAIQLLRYSVILVFYFILGVTMELPSLAIFWHMRDQYGVSPAKYQMMMTDMQIPWTIKWVFGFISDVFPIMGYRRRPYIMGAMMLCSVAWYLQSTPVVDDSVTLFMVGMVVVSTTMCNADVIVDGVVVESTKKIAKVSVKMSKYLLPMCWISRGTGNLVTAFASGHILTLTDPDGVFRIMATIPVVVFVLAVFLPEEKVGVRVSTEPVLVRVRRIWAAVSNPVILKPALFLLISGSMPTMGETSTYYFTSELGFSKDEMGALKMTDSTCMLVGIGIYMVVFSRLSTRTVFTITTLSAGLSMLCFLFLIFGTGRAMGIPDFAFAILDTGLIDVLNFIGLMPVLALCAEIAPVGAEAVIFAFLISTTNSASMVSGTLSAILIGALGITATDFSNLWILVLISSIARLVYVPLIPLLIPKDPTSVHDPRINGGGGPTEVADAPASAAMADGDKEEEGKEAAADKGPTDLEDVREEYPFGDEIPQ